MMNIWSWKQKRHNYLPNIIICICNNFSWNCFENNNSEIQRVFSLHQSEICWAWTNGLRVRVNILLTLHWFKNRTNLKSAWRKKNYFSGIFLFCFIYDKRLQDFFRKRGRKVHIRQSSWIILVQPNNHQMLFIWLYFFPY